MRIVHDSPTQLVLRGRRTDGEEGETGLWLVWLVGAAMAGGGLLCAATIDDAGARWMGRGFLVFGAAVTAFGLHRLRRRESLSFDRVERTLQHSTRHWPGTWRTAFASDYAAARSVEIERRVEGASGDHDHAALPTVVWRVRLVLHGRRRVALTATKDDAEASALARTVATTLAVPIEPIGTT